MSYILEALVQAQLERQCRGVPGLYTVQTLPRPRAAPHRRWPLALGGVAAGLSGLLAVAWLQPWQRDVPEAAAPIVSSASIAVPEPAQPAVVSLATPGLAPAAPMQQLRENAPKTGAIVAKSGEARRKHQRKVRKGKDPRPASATLATLPGTRLYSVGELPIELQKVARSISIAGFALSEESKERMAIINNRALREGEEVSGGLRVERIAGDGVIFNLKGYRFRKGRT